MNKNELTITNKNENSDFVSIAYSPDDTKIVSTSKKNICIWDTTSGNCLTTLNKKDVKLVSYNPYGTRILLLFDDGKVVVIDPMSESCPETWDTENKIGVLTGALSSKFVAYNNDGTKIVCAIDKLIKVFDLNTGECIKTLEGHTEKVNCVSYSPGGSRIISCSGDSYEGKDKSVRIWNSDSGVCEKIFLGHKNIINYVVFSSDGRRALSLSLDNTIQVWDVDPDNSTYGNSITKIESTQKNNNSWPLSFSSAAFSLDRRYIMSSVDERSGVFIWDAVKGSKIKDTFYTGLLNQVIVSHDGNSIAIAFKGKIIIKKNDLGVLAGGKKDINKIKKKSKKLIDTFKKYDLVKIAKNYEISLKTRDNKSKTKLQLFNSLKRKKLI